MPAPDTLACFIASVASNAHVEAVEEFYTIDSMPEHLSLICNPICWLI
jgi:hypothetical protein